MEPLRIVLVSDSHGEKDRLKRIREKHADADMFVHCGDAGMTAEELQDWITVEGNHDRYPPGSVPLNRVIEAGTHRIYMCHGHADFLSYFHYGTMTARARKNGCDIVFFGHVHTYLDAEEDGVRLLNPGSVWHNRDGTPPSYMLVCITDDAVTAQRMDCVPEKTAKKKSLLERLIDRWND